MKVSIVKYNAGNIFSVINSVKRLGIEPLWTDDPMEIASSDRVIFPGQGHARTAMEYLREHNLDKVIADLKQPVLGICIGQQLLCQHSEEGDTDCIGIFPINVRRFQPTCHEQKVPAMGWNAIHDLKSPLFKGLNDDIQHATQLVSLLKGLRCRVNLIPFHPSPDTPFQTSSTIATNRFRDYINAHGITCTVRTSRGQDIMAACGLLAGQTQT